ncbi:hypothetical protein [Ornithinimicrobium panacihumi]|uniref:hypothetical protein n=1 Tax=Ornithinimicrobium panacihumi TaxID=2008449 RepID=UPI003F886801
MTENTAWFDKDSDQDAGTERDGEGNFVGGSFGKPSLAKESHEQTTAQEVEQEAEDPTLASAPAPAEVEETIEDEGGSTFAAADVEGTTTEPAPGERNEPV